MRDCEHGFLFCFEREGLLSLLSFVLLLLYLFSPPPFFRPPPVSPSSLSICPLPAVPPAQATIRSFLAVQRARVYVLSAAWYVAERRILGRQDGRLGEEGGSGGKMEDGGGGKKKKKKKKKKSGADISVPDCGKTDGGKSAADNSMKYAKQDAIREAGNTPPAPKFERIDSQVKEKNAGCKKRRPIKTCAAALSKAGMSSWIPSDSLAVAKYLSATTSPAVVPEHLFRSTAVDRRSLFSRLTKRAREICSERRAEERCAEERGEARGRVEAADRQGLGEFATAAETADIKRTTAGDPRLSQRKKSARNITPKTTPRPPVLLYTAASHVKFNSEVNAIVGGGGGGGGQGGGKPPRTGATATRIRINGARDPEL